MQAKTALRQLWKRSWQGRHAIQQIPAIIRLLHAEACSVGSDHHDQRQHYIPMLGVLTGGKRTKMNRAFGVP